MAVWSGAVPRRRTSEATRRAPYRWDREAAAAGERRQVFCMSLGDFWDNQVPDEWRTEALNIIRQCRNLDWLILTKRPQNILKMLPPDWGPLGWSQVWLGATVENMIGGAAASPNPPACTRPCALAVGRTLLEPLDLRPWLGTESIGSLLVARLAPRMLATWNRTGRVICAISASDTGAALFLKQMWKRQPIPADFDGARISGALIGWPVATARILNLRGLGYSLRLHESAADPSFICAAASARPARSPPSLAASPPVPSSDFRGVPAHDHRGDHPSAGGMMATMSSSSSTPRTVATSFLPPWKLSSISRSITTRAEAGSLSRNQSRCGMQPI